MKNKKKKIGILGGGQLARMLVLKAHEKGYEPHVLSSSALDPSAQVTTFWTQGDIHNKSDLIRFFKKIDVATFENEFMNVEILKQVIQKTKIQTRPHPSILHQLQDRWLQKNLLYKHKIPTAPFKKIDSYEDLLKAFKFFKQRMVLKKRRFGYDGNGTFILQSLRECQKLKSSIDKDGFIAEAFIPFKREMATLIVTHKNMKPIGLPFVETFHKNLRCFWVKGPVNSSKAQLLNSKLKSFVQKIKYEGIIAFELFDTTKEIYVNEIAPRVHNSGHYSLNALSQDQFSLHLDACLRNPISQPELLSPGFAMLNLLGKEEHSPKWKKQKGVFLHAYGKKEKRKLRKMGHLNSIDQNPHKALKKLLKAETSFK